MKKLVLVWSLMILFCCSIALAQTNTVLLIDFGGTAQENIYGLPGWNTPLLDRYTENHPIGPGGATIDRGSNRFYNYQGIQGTSHTFVQGDIIRVTWYNSQASPITFTPHISFVDEGQYANGELGTLWHQFPELTIPGENEGTSEYVIPSNLAGAYSIVNVNSFYSNTQILIADKIELITDSDVPTSPPQDPPEAPQDPPPGNQGSCFHEADTVCAADGEDECGLSEKELRQYARKVLKRQKSLLDLVAAVQVFLNLETLCPGTHQRKQGGQQTPPEEEPEVEPEPSGPAVCGNGRVEAGEQCDDGGTQSGDGCSSTCQYEGECGTEECPAESFLGASSLEIEGQQWTFRTPPPSDLTFRTDHPRLLFNPEDVAALKEKLADPVYADDMDDLVDLADTGRAEKGKALANALLYHLHDDASRADNAKQYLLAGSFPQQGGVDAASIWNDPVFVYDLIFDTLTTQEKKDIFDLVKANYRYEEGLAKEISDFEFYWNDEWARHRQMHIPILALTIKGENVDDAWADDIINKALNEQDGAIGPYGGVTGRGLLDGLASLSLDDGGGKQAGSYGWLVAGYYSMFAHSFMPLIAWDSATNDDLWPKVNFYRRIGSYWAYEKYNYPAQLGRSLLEMNTGIYKTIDPDEAALSRWHLDRHGRDKFLLPYRLILGDLRVQPKSPEQLGFPEAKYIRGSDLFVSSDSWADDALTVTVLARYLDTSRYEPHSGIFAITRAQESYAVPGEHNKQPTKVGTYSGMVIRKKGTGKPYSQGSTYWADVENYPSHDNKQKVRRAKNPLQAVSDPGYFPGGPDVVDISNNKRVMSIEYARLVDTNGAKKVRRTIAHLVEPDRNFVVVYDYTDLTSDLERVWQLRLAEEPSLSGSDFSIAGMHGTIVSPQSPTVEWVGGYQKEHLLPAPDYTYYSNGRGGAIPGYSVPIIPDRSGYNTEEDWLRVKKLREDETATRINRWGLGNLFIQKSNEPTVMEHLVVMEVTNGAKTPVNRISDSSASFGKWTVDFNLDGSYSITEN